MFALIPLRCTFFRHNDLAVFFKKELAPFGTRNRYSWYDCMPHKEPTEVCPKASVAFSAHTKALYSRIHRSLLHIM